MSLLLLILLISVVIVVVAVVIFVVAIAALVFASLRGVLSLDAFRRFRYECVETSGTLSSMWLPQLMGKERRSDDVTVLITT